MRSHCVLVDISWCNRAMSCDRSTFISCRVAQARTSVIDAMVRHDTVNRRLMSCCDVLAHGRWSERFTIGPVQWHYDLNRTIQGLLVPPHLIEQAHGLPA